MRRCQTNAIRSLFAQAQPASDSATRLAKAEDFEAVTGKGVTVFDKNGKQLGNIPIEKSWTANVTFGGPEMKTLFITAMDSVFTLEMAVSGAR